MLCRSTDTAINVAEMFSVLQQLQSCLRSLPQYCVLRNELYFCRSTHERGLWRRVVSVCLSVYHVRALYQNE